MGNEPAIETLSAATRARWRGDKRPTNVQLGISAKLYKEMRKLAASQGMPFSTWLRSVALAELRRARKRN
jgi:predicted DNA binding CopG/RHH family protein